MTIARPMVAVLTIAAATSLGGCYYVPLLNEAAFRARHASQRDSPESKAAIQKQLEQFSCFQLSEWEQLLLVNLKAGEDALRYHASACRFCARTCRASGKQ